MDKNNNELSKKRQFIIEKSCYFIIIAKSDRQGGMLEKLYNALLDSQELLRADMEITNVLGQGGHSAVIERSKKLEESLP